MLFFILVGICRLTAILIFNVEMTVVVVGRLLPLEGSFESC